MKKSILLGTVLVAFIGIALWAPQVQALSCPGGFYEATPGDLFCTGCPCGYKCAGGDPPAAPVACANPTPPNQAGCGGAECGLGQYFTDMCGNCADCPCGYDCQAGDLWSEITSCVAGDYSPAGEFGCLTCESGYVTPDGCDCVDCPPGEYDDGICTECPCGSYCPGYDTVIACGAGEYAAAGSGECTACPEGFEPAADLCSCEELAVTLVSFEAKAGNAKVTLTWETGSEEDNAGFNIYRKEAGSSDYEKINAALIPSTVGTGLGAVYSLVDENVQNRTKYTYVLEDVDINGIATPHDPVSATPRILRMLHK
ncbi:hypothetical protein ACFL43_03010 [Thermodesulfobacteriota bacterium]